MTRGEEREAAGGKIHMYVVYGTCAGSIFMVY